MSYKTIVWLNFDDENGPHEKHLGRREFSFFVRHENDNGTFKSSDKWQRTE